MKSEFVLAFNEVLEEKGLPKEVVLEALEAAMVSAYRRAVMASNAQHVEAKIDLETGKVAIYAEKEVVEGVQDGRTEVSLNEARKVDAEAVLGGMVVVETTPRNFGRVAAQTARQVIQQRIREAERDTQMEFFSKQTGEIVSGVVQAVNSQAITLGLDMKAEGIMPRNQQVSGERFRLHDRVRALLLEVKATPRGPQIILSRAHRNFLRRLLENEVPEIYHGMVEVRSIAREPGHRSKVAVAALQPGVDPVGACVGIRGVRIQAIVRELNDEKIDVIEWSNDPTVYIAKALSPARVNGVFLNEHAKGTKTATVVVPEDQLSLAIGRDGQNARLAAKLTSWRIDIKSLPEAAADSVHKLHNDPYYASLAERETDVIGQVETILAKKAEGRPVTPEEYTVLSQFVDRVERGYLHQREKEKRADEERARIAQAQIPEAAYNIPVEEMGISLRFATLLGGAGYTTAGDLMLQIQLDPDLVLGLDGIGPKAMAEIEAAIERLDSLKVTEEAAEVQEVESEAAVVEVAEGEEPAAVLEVEIPAVEEVIEPVSEAEVGVSAEAVLEEVAAEPSEAEALEGLAPEPLAAGEQPEIEEQPVAEEQPAVSELAVEEPLKMEDLFAWRADALELDEVAEEDEDEDEDQASRKTKKKKKKKKYVEVEFDPDRNMVVAKKKRKRGGWSDDWEY